MFTVLLYWFTNVHTCYIVRRITTNPQVGEVINFLFSVQFIILAIGMDYNTVIMYSKVLTVHSTYMQIISSHNLCLAVCGLKSLRRMAVFHVTVLNVRDIYNTTECCPADQHRTYCTVGLLSTIQFLCYVMKYIYCIVQLCHLIIIFHLLVIINQLSHNVANYQPTHCLLQTTAHCFKHVVKLH